MNSQRNENSYRGIIHTDADQNSLDYGQMNESLVNLMEKKNLTYEKKEMNINESFPGDSMLSLD